MEHVKIIERVKNVLEEQMGVEAAQLKFGDSLVDDLGADSFDLLELVMAVEEEFNIEIQDEEAERVKTVGDVVGTVIAKTTGLAFDPEAIQLSPKDTEFLTELIKNPPAPVPALVKAAACAKRAEPYETPETVKMRLTIDVEYRLNGERVKDADFHLHELVQTAVNRGMLTGDSPMEVESHSYNVERVE